MSLYGSNEYKKAGIKEEPVILEKVIKFLKSQKFSVTAKQSTLLEDIHKKFDYCLIFDKSKLFSGRDKIYVDVKYARTFTLYDNNGYNTLENSKSDYIIFNDPKNNSKLTWINTKRLIECLKINKPILYKSREENNTSEYFWIEDYIRKNKTWFEKNSKSVNI